MWRTTQTAPSRSRIFSKKSPCRVSASPNPGQAAQAKQFETGSYNAPYRNHSSIFPLDRV
jgi:hypothetical protein